MQSSGLVVVTFEDSGMVWMAEYDSRFIAESILKIARSQDNLYALQETAILSLRSEQNFLVTYSVENEFRIF